MGDYSALMRRLEEAEMKEEEEEIMQKIIPILGCSQYAPNKVPQHIMVYSKRLSPNDKRRLKIEGKDVEFKILPFLNLNEDIKEGIPVTVYGRDGRPYDMTLRRKNRSLGSYVLHGHWSSFFLEQAFGVGDYITVWLFRERHPLTRHLRLVIAPRQVHKA